MGKERSTNQLTADQAGKCRELGCRFLAEVSGGSTTITVIKQGETLDAYGKFGINMAKIFLCTAKMNADNKLEGAPEGCPREV